MARIKAMYLHAPIICLPDLCFEEVVNRQDLAFNTGMKLSIYNCPLNCSKHDQIGGFQLP